MAMREMEFTYLLLIPLVGLILMFILNKRTTWAIIQDSRITRVIHYYLIYLFGISLAKTNANDILQHYSLHIIRELLFFIALFMAAIFAIVTNNHYDKSIDEISNPNRPLIRDNHSLKVYLLIGVLNLLCSIIISLFLGIDYVIIIVGISFIYFVYSCPPLRLKRFVFLAKLLIGLNHLLICIEAYQIAGGAWKEFPVFWTVFLGIGISLLANIIDIKDVDGDQRAGIKTLPVLIGIPKTKLFLAVVILMTYTALIWHYEILLIQLIIAVTGLIHLSILLISSINDKWLFLFHNLLFVGLNGIQILSLTNF